MQQNGQERPCPVMTVTVTVMCLVHSTPIMLLLFTALKMAQTRLLIISSALLLLHQRRFVANLLSVAAVNRATGDTHKTRLHLTNNDARHRCGQVKVENQAVFVEKYVRTVQ